MRLVIFPEFAVGNLLPTVDSKLWMQPHNGLDIVYHVVHFVYIKINCLGFRLTVLPNNKFEQTTIQSLSLTHPVDHFDETHCHLWCTLSELETHCLTFRQAVSFGDKL